MNYAFPFSSIEKKNAKQKKMQNKKKTEISTAMQIMKEEEKATNMMMKGHHQKKSSTRKGERTNRLRARIQTTKQYQMPPTPLPPLLSRAIIEMLYTL